MLGLSVIPALLQLWGMTYMPKSPEFLLLKKDKKLAKEILMKFYVDYRNPIAEVERVMQSVDSEQEVAGFVELFQPGIRMALLAGCGLQFFQQFCGINTVMYYSAKIFESEGIETNQAIYWSCLIAALNFLLTFPGLVMIDKFGRRPLAMISLSGCMFSCSLMTVGEWMDMSKLSLLSLALYIISFAPGMGPVPWTVNSEIYPLKFRSMGNSVSSAVNWVSNIIVSQIFPVIVGVIGTGTTFVGFAGFCLLAILFIFCFVPETKGLSMSEISRLFEKQEHSSEMTETEEVISTSGAKRLRRR